MSDGDLENKISVPMFDDPALQADFERWVTENMGCIQIFLEMSDYEKLLSFAVGNFHLSRSIDLVQQCLAIACSVLDADGSSFTEEQREELSNTVKGLAAIQVKRERDRNLASGRQKGAEKQREVAERNKALIVIAFRDLIRSPDWSRKSLGDIAAYLARNFAESHRLRQANGKPYSVSTIRNWIKGAA